MTTIYTMTAEIRQPYKGKIRTYGPYPFNPGPYFDAYGVTAAHFDALALRARLDGAVSGRCEIVYRAEGGHVVREEIVII